MATKTCPVCGKVFKGRTKQIYCGQDCFYEERRKDCKKVCPICGKSFRAKLKNQIYCGRSCAAFGRAQERKTDKAPKQPKARNCEYCGKEYLAQNGGQRYCGISCAAAAREERNRRRRESPVDKVCPICGKEFRATLHQIYCSRACAGKGAKHRDNTPVGEREKKLVHIRITKEIPVFPALRPPVGGVYEAEEKTGDRNGERFYVVRGIGKYGIIVRQDECVQI